MSKAFDHDNKLFDCLFGKSGGIGASRERLKDLAGQLAKIWRRKASGPKEQQQAQLKQRPVKTFTNAVKQAHETDEARAQAWSNASNQSPGHLGIPPYTLLVLGHPIQGDCLTWMLKFLIATTERGKRKQQQKQQVRAVAAAAVVNSQPQWMRAPKALAYVIGNSDSGCGQRCSSGCKWWQKQ
eukprot:scaffold178614_cov18-Tisochrysis_lutea.AAC.1